MKLMTRWGIHMKHFSRKHSKWSGVKSQGHSQVVKVVLLPKQKKGQYRRQWMQRQLNQGKKCCWIWQDLLKLRHLETSIWFKWWKIFLVSDWLHSAKSATPYLNGPKSKSSWNLRIWGTHLNIFVAMIMLERTKNLCSKKQVLCNEYGSVFVLTTPGRHTATHWRGRKEKCTLATMRECKVDSGKCYWKSQRYTLGWSGYCEWPRKYHSEHGSKYQSLQVIFEAQIEDLCTIDQVWTSRIHYHLS